MWVWNFGSTRPTQTPVRNVLIVGIYLVTRENQSSCWLLILPLVYRLLYDVRGLKTLLEKKKPDSLLCC